jgi:hypothetical protein
MARAVGTGSVDRFKPLAVYCRGMHLATVRRGRR